MKRLLWCITGAGGYLRDVYYQLKQFRERFPHVEIEIVMSKAGLEVSRIYGVLDDLRHIASGGRYGLLHLDVSPSGIGRYGIPLGGRVSLRRYNIVLIAPASSNTVAKIAHGIADSPPTIASSQALKAGVPLVVLPADNPSDPVTTLPCYIDMSKCTLCYSCVKECPYKAISVEKDGTLHLDYTLCRGCGLCGDVCDAKAVRCWEKARINITPIDLENIEKLRKMPKTFVVNNPYELVEKIASLLGI